MESAIVKADARNVGVIIIYMKKPQIPVGKSDGSRHSVWDGFRKHGLCFEVMQFFYSVQSTQMIWIYFVAGCSPTTSNPIVLLSLCTGFPPGCFVSMVCTSSSVLTSTKHLFWIEK